jgi:hypothetical protein
VAGKPVESRHRWLSSLLWGKLWELQPTCRCRRHGNVNNGLEGAEWQHVLLHSSRVQRSPRKHPFQRSDEFHSWWSHTHTHAQPQSFTNSDTDANSNSHFDTHTHTYSYSYPYSDSNAQRDANSERHANTNTQRHTDSYAERHANPKRNPNCNSDTNP